METEMVWYFAAGFAGGFLGAACACALLYFLYVADDGEEQFLRDKRAYDEMRRKEEWFEGAFKDGED